MTGLPPHFRTAPGLPEELAPITSRDHLVAFLRAGCKRDDDKRLGVEWEQLPLRADGQAAPYVGPPGCVRDVLQFLVSRGLEPIEIEGNLLMLRGPDYEVHLEPGAQVELVLPPVATATEVHARLASWRALLAGAASATGVHVVPLGFQPLTPVPDIRWIPKGRYRIMSEHLGARGRLAHHMMKATAGLQLNLDFTSEEDAADLVRAALALSPLVNAMVLGSPLEEGRPNGFLSLRPAIWAETDPERCGLLPWVFDEGFSFRRYVDWALGVTVMFVHRDGRWHALGDRTFGEFIDRGHETLGPALHADFHLHLTTLFPEVRTKQHVEIRGADSCSVELAAGLVAAWRGVLYDGAARSRAYALVADLSMAEREALHVDVSRRGLRARVRGTEVAELSREVLRAAEDGLLRLEGPSGSDASHLDALRAVLDSGRTPAEQLLADWDPRNPGRLLTGSA